MTLKWAAVCDIPGEVESPSHGSILILAEVGGDRGQTVSPLEGGSTRASLFGGLGLPGTCIMKETGIAPASVMVFWMFL